MNPRQKEIIANLKYFINDVIQIILSFEFQGKIDCTFKAYKERIISIHILSDEKRIVSCDKESIIIWNLSGEQLITIFTNVSNILIMKNDSIAVVDNLHNLKIYDSNTGNIIYNTILISPNNMDNPLLHESLTNGSIFYSERIIGHPGFANLYIINRQKQNQYLITTYDNIDSENIVSLPNNRFILQKEWYENRFAIYNGENIPVIKEYELQLNKPVIFNILPNLNIIYINKDDSTINIIESKTSNPLIGNKILYNITEMVTISNDQIVLLEHNMWSHDIKRKSLYLYNIKDNVLSKLRDVPSNTKIISILAKTQILLSECHDGNHNLMIVDILFPSIIIPISLPEKILKYNFSKTKTLLESKIICGSRFSDIVILK